MDVDALADAMYLAREECVDDVSFLCGVMVDSCECLSKHYEHHKVDEACYDALTAVNQIIEENTEYRKFEGGGEGEGENQGEGQGEGEVGGGGAIDSGKVCTDDPKGWLVRRSLNFEGAGPRYTCPALVDELGCDYDLHEKNQMAPPGLQVYMLCPLTCNACEDDTEYVSPLEDFASVVQHKTFVVDLVEPEEDFSCSQCSEKGFGEDQCLCGVCGSFGYCTFSCHAEVDERYRGFIEQYIQRSDLKLASCVPSRYSNPGCWFGKAHSTKVLKDWLRGCKYNCEAGCSGRNDMHGDKKSDDRTETHGFADWNQATQLKNGANKSGAKSDQPVETIILASSLGVVGIGLGYLAASRRIRKSKGKVLDTTSFPVANEKKPMDDSLE
jgi:hypothetical protein